MLRTCAGLLAFEETYLQFLDDSRFVRYEEDSERFEDALSILKRVYTKPVLGPEFSIAKSEKEVVARKVLVKEMAALAVREWVNSWIVPTKLVTLQRSPVNIIHFGSNTYKKEMISKTYKPISLLVWY